MQGEIQTMVRKFLADPQNKEAAEAMGARGEVSVNELPDGLRAEIQNVQRRCVSRCCYLPPPACKVTRYVSILYPSLSDLGRADSETRWRPQAPPPAAGWPSSGCSSRSRTPSGSASSRKW